MSLFPKTTKFLVFLNLISWTAYEGSLFAQSRTDIIAQSGQAAPDANGTYSISLTRC